MAEKFDNNTHRCLASGCKTPIAKAKLMCPYHWNMLPLELQNKVYSTFRNRGNSPEGPANHRTTMLEAASFVMKHEKALKEQGSLIANWQPEPTLNRLEPAQMVTTIAETFKSLGRPRPRLMLTSGMGSGCGYNL